MSELKLQQCRLDGRYDIQECLGRGSYAEVYLARDVEARGGSPQMVVIKALNVMLQGAVDLELERTLIENFRNEAVALDRVRHPNVINRLGHGTAIDLAGQTFHYLVLEYLPGGDLASLCRGNPLPLDRAIFYLRQVCDGLAHAHDHGVIHRDVKPQNLLLTADGETVKISDFGVAKLDALEGTITRVGTEVYAAPEHHPLAQTGPLDPAAVTRRVTHLTPAADVYSLAKTTYMLLTGDAPRRFSQKPITELPAPAAQKPWASFVLRVLRRATETNPEARYQSVRAFWDELSDALMPKTQLLTERPGEETRPLAQLVRPAESTELPPQPQPVNFVQRVRRPEPSDGQQANTRPRIVVPVAPDERPRAAEAREQAPQAQGPPATRQTQGPTAPRAEAERGRPAERPTVNSRRERLAANARRLLVTALLISGFVLLLLGIHYSVRSRQRAAATAAQTSPPAATSQPQAGREMLTTTNVNLRTGPSRTFEKIGEVESGSRVRVLQVSGGWCEVRVLERGVPRRGLDAYDQGWIDGTRLR